MEKISLEIFTSVQDDLEKRQYLILAFLQRSRMRFKRNRIYPELGVLTNLYKQLTHVQQSFRDMKSDFPKQITGINIEKQTLEYRISAPYTGNLMAVEELIAWALPHIKSVIEEGVAVYEFIKENIALEKVGVEPQYRNEGYFIVPDNSQKNLRLYQFELSIYTASQEKFRALKTRFIKTLVHSYVEKPPSDIKIDLIREFKELPNPATYACQTDLDFPFRESIFPVARRKLMEQFYT